MVDHTTNMEIGISKLLETTPDPVTGKVTNHAGQLRNNEFHRG